MIQCPKYNPNKDLKQVQPNGALDLKKAFANGTIPADLQVQDSRFNEISNPAAIVGRVSDTIDAEVQSRNLQRLEPPKQE